MHIDFGDCFEVAMERDAFPEKLPFRLTRQLITALGPTGVEGTYKVAFQVVAGILRQSKDSVEAVFNNFVHDPLIQHLVLNPQQLPDGQGKSENLSTLTDPQDEAAHIGTPQTRFPTKRRRAGTDSGKPVTQLSPRAQRVVARAKQKLNGTEFGTETPLSVEEQTVRLINQATDVFALSSTYQGWCPWW